MKRLLRLVLILIVVVWSGGTTLAQDLNAIMWQEGILFGRFSVCFADNSNVDRNLGRTFTDAYIHWYQVNNPRIDMKVPVSMFANGLHAGAAEQQNWGLRAVTPYTSASAISDRLSAFVFLMCPGNHKPRATILRPAPYRRQPLYSYGTPTLVGCRGCARIN